MQSVLAIALDFDAHRTFATVVAAALPSAQSTYVFAVACQRTEIVERDTVLLATFASLPVISLLAA